MTTSSRRRVDRATWTSVLAAGLLPLVLVLLPLSGRFFFGLDLTRIDLAVACVGDAFSIYRDGWLLPWFGNGSSAIDAALGRTYLPRILFSGLSPDAALTALVITHFALWSAGTALLARTFHLRPMTSIAAGLLVAASGTALNASLHGFYMFAAVWVPWAWAAARRATQSGARVDRLLLFVALTQVLHAGEPQSFCIAAALVLFQASWTLRCEGRGAWRRAAVSSSMVPLAFGALLVIWLPTLRELQLTPRGARLSFDEALTWSLDARAALGMWWPGLWTTAVAPHTTLSAISSGNPATQPWNLAPYTGAIVLVAAVAGVFERRTRAAVVVAAAALLAALGPATPIMPLAMKVVPLLALFRYPEKYLPIATVALVVVAAGALERVGRSHRRRRRFACAALPASALLAVGVVVVVVWGGALDVLASEIGTEPAAVDQPLASELARGAALQPLLFLVLALIALRFVSHPSRGLLVLAVIDIVTAFVSSVQVGPSLADARSPLSAFGVVDTHRVPVVCIDPRLENDVVVNRGVGGPWAQALFARQWGYAELQACDGLTSPAVYSPLTSRTQRAFIEQLDDAPDVVAAALGCDLLVSDQELDLQRLPMGAAQGERDSIYGVHVYAPGTGLAAAFVVPQARLVNDEAALLAAVFSATDALQLRALVDDPLRALAGTALPPQGIISEIAADWPRRDEARLQVAGEGGAVLGLNTTFLVGWSASQAGRALPVVRIAGQHVGTVVADVGAGPIELRYQPPGLASGAAASVCSLVLAAVAIAMRLRKRKRAA